MAWAGTGSALVMEGNPEVVQLEPAGRDWRPRTLANSASCRSATPYGIQQAANSRCRNVESGRGEDQCLSKAPEFMLHTGDISHLSKPEEFDTVDPVLKVRARRMCSSYWGTRRVER